MLVEIFQSGKHTAADGTEHEYNESDLDNIVSKYDPEIHEAPVVYGHPKTDSPAGGWVKKLFRQGKKLFAEIDFIPEFAESIKRGLFKKRSIALNPDGTLKHVGVLGAAPPAVKGMANIKFNGEDKSTLIEFSTEQQKEIDMTDEEKNSLEAKIKEQETMITQYSEQIKKQADVIVSFETKAKEAEKTARNVEYSAFCDKMVTEGKLLPANKDGVIAYMESQHNAKVVEFSENGKTITKTPNQLYMESIDKLPAHALFSEAAKKAESGNSKDVTREEKISQYMKGESTTYAEAVKAISQTNPEFWA
jgi:hypothetical protein